MRFIAMILPGCSRGGNRRKLCDARTGDATRRPRSAAGTESQLPPPAYASEEKASLARPPSGDVVPQDAGLELELVEASLHDVTDRDDSAQPAVLHHDEVTQPLSGHAHHQVANVIVDVARGCTAHDTREGNRADVAVLAAEQLHDVTLADDADDHAAAHDRQCTDAVLDHQSYRCIDPRIRVDRDHGRAAPPQQLPDAHCKNLRLAGVWITGRAIHVPRHARQDTGEGAARRCRSRWKDWKCQPSRARFRRSRKLARQLSRKDDQILTGGENWASTSGFSVGCTSRWV